MAMSTEPVVNQLSIHRFLSTSLLVSVKFLDDSFYSNEYYAYGVGVSLQELNALEADFLKAIQWKLDFSPEEHSRYQQLLATSARSATPLAGS
jgi:hypothetical protein